MRIINLTLKDFRNYNELDIDFEEAFNIIYGNNAQGKTNIIESIFLCASGRSHRTSKDFELLRNEADYFKVRLLLEKEGIQEEIEITYNKQERKKIRINEITLRKIGDLMGHLNAVIFSPEDLLIIKQGPAERRRFIDITLSQLKPAYFYDLQQYARILYQRNTLLKSIMMRKENEATLEVWDRHLVRTGLKIMKARNEFVLKLDTLAKLRHEKLTNREENLSLQYLPSFEHLTNSSDKGLEEEFIRQIESNRMKEIKKGSSMFGPHRDDIDIILNGESTKIYGSQGQQRTSVLSMKLAEIDLMKQESGDYPVLLLDDVLSELDDKRKEQLLDSINGMQTFITCTERRFFQRSEDKTAFFHIENGNIADTAL